MFPFQFSVARVLLAASFSTCVSKVEYLILITITNLAITITITITIITIYYYLLFTIACWSYVG